jgi:hypothetical protein
MIGLKWIDIRNTKGLVLLLYQTFLLAMAGGVVIIAAQMKQVDEAVKLKFERQIWHECLASFCSRQCIRNRRGKMRRIREGRRSGITLAK